MRRWQDAAWLGVRVTLLYSALTAPQTVAGPKSLIVLGFISLFKFVVVTAMTMTLFLVRKHFYILLSCLVACIATYAYAVTSKAAESEGTSLLPVETAYISLADYWRFIKHWAN